MKIFITTDLEGVSGVVHPEHTMWDGRRHHEARQWLTDDVNAAIEAAVEMGATEVLVCDGHSSARNLLVGQLHPAAMLMFGRSGRRLGQMEGIDASFAAVFQIGFHARVGTPSTLNHTTNSGVLTHSTINGRAVGELDLNAAIAGEFGVPVAMASGDAAAMAEMKDLCPWAETAVVKWPVGMYAAKIMAPVKEQAVIRDAVRRALARLDEMQPVTFDKPTTIELGFKDTALADAAALMPGAVRTSNFAVAFTGQDIFEAYRAHLVMITLATREQWQTVP